MRHRAFCVDCGVVCWTTCRAVSLGSPSPALSPMVHFYKERGKIGRKGATPLSVPLFLTCYVDGRDGPIRLYPERCGGDGTCQSLFVPLPHAVFPRKVSKRGFRPSCLFFPRALAASFLKGASFQGEGETGGEDGTHLAIPEGKKQGAASVSVPRPLPHIGSSRLGYAPRT